MKDGHDQGVTVGGSDAFYVRWAYLVMLEIPPVFVFICIYVFGWVGMGRDGKVMMR